ncbi:hypothetical protein D3C77_109280 [compost metagenome]
MEVFRRTADQIRHDHQPATMQQRAEDFPDREVEGVGMEQGPGVAAVETEPLPSGGEQPLHVVVTEQGAFRLPGRARCVDDVGQVIRAHAHLRVGIAEALQVLVQAQARTVKHRQTQTRLAQQQADAAVLDHVLQTLGRVHRVQRHIGTARLEDRQQTDHQLQRTLGRQTDTALRANPGGDQAVSQTVGPRVELGIAQLLPFKDQGHSLRRARSLFGNLLMQANLAGVAGHCRVQALDDDLLLRRGHHRQLTNAALRLIDDRPQHGLPVLHHALDGGRFEYIGGKDKAASE